MKPVPVARRALLDRRVSLSWWAVGTALYVSMIMAVWPVIDGNSEFEDLAESYPDSIKALVGGQDAFDAFTTPVGFLDTYLFAMFLPFIFVGLAVAIGAALLGGDEEQGLLELLLSYPVARSSAVLQKALAMTVAVVGLAATVLLLIWGAGAFVDLEVGVGALASALLGTVLYAIFHGQLALMAGAAGGRKGLAVGVAWGAALGGYLLNVVSGLDASLGWLRWLSPLHYATSGAPLTDGPPIEYLAIAGGFGLALLATLWLFGRHDLR